MNVPSENRLIAPPPPKDVGESLAAYFELLDLGEAFLRAGLRNHLGAGADIDAAYRAWNREHIERAADEKIRYLQEALCGGVDDDR